MVFGATKVGGLSVVGGRWAGATAFPERGTFSDAHGILGVYLLGQNSSEPVLGCRLSELVEFERTPHFEDIRKKLTELMNLYVLFCVPREVSLLPRSYQTVIVNQVLLLRSGAKST